MKINSINNNHNIYKKQNTKDIRFKQKSFVEDKIDINASLDGKFSKKEAGKNFLKGIFSPLKAIVEHPILSVGTAAVAGIACSLVPILSPIMSIGFGALSIFQLSKGIITSIQEYKKGNYDNSEKAFENIGQGTIGTIGSLTSVKRNSRIVEEAYAMNSLERTKLSFRERTKIKNNANDRNYFESLKVIFSMFTTENGRKTLINQFKPFLIKERAKDLVSSINLTNRKTDTIKTFDEKMYKKTPEGRRRASLTDTEVEQLVRTEYDRVFDELGIGKEYRPELIIKNIDSPLAGSYDTNSHSVLYNINSYRNGLGDIDEVLMHEGTHCKRALLRSGLSRTELKDTVKSILRSKILNGDAEEVPYSSNTFCAETVKTPIMSSKMRFDFLKLAESELFVDDTLLNKRLIDYQHQHSLAMGKSGYANPSKLHSAEVDILPVLEKLKEILNKHPDFIKQYNSYDEALDILLKYSIAQNSRYSAYSFSRVGHGIKYPISPSQIEEAKHSVREYINTRDGNNVVSKCIGNFVDRKAYNQYQFSDEEVLAHKTANEYVLRKSTDELTARKAIGLLSPEREQYLNNQIEKTSLVIEQRTKGLEYYKNKIRLRNNPNNSPLRTVVEQQEQELEKLRQQINAFRPQYKEKVISYFDKMTSINPFNLIAMTLSKIQGKKEQ